MPNIQNNTGIEFFHCMSQLTIGAMLTVKKNEEQGKFCGLLRMVSEKRF